MRLLFITLISFFATCALAGDTRVTKACSEPANDDIQRIWVQINCPGPTRCWADPDDLILFDEEKNETTGCSSTFGVSVNYQGKEWEQQPPLPHFMAVLDFSCSQALAPRIASIRDSSLEAITKEFNLQDNCSQFDPSVARIFAQFGY